MSHNQLLSVFYSHDIERIAVLCLADRRLLNVMLAAEFFLLTYQSALKAGIHQPRTFSVANAARHFHIRESYLRNYLAENNL